MTRFPYNLFKSEDEIDRQIEQDERRAEMLKDDRQFQDEPIKDYGQKHDNHTPTARTAE